MIVISVASYLNYNLSKIIWASLSEPHIDEFDMEFVYINFSNGHINEGYQSSVYVFPIIGLSLSGVISAVATTNLLLETANMLRNGGGDNG